MPSIVGRGVRVEVASTYTAVANAVTAISLANPGILSSVAHGFLAKDVGFLSSVEGMANLEGQAVRAIAPVAADTFALEGINSTLYSPFSGSAILTKATNWLLLAKATSYSFGGGGPEKLDDTGLVDDYKQELFGSLEAQSATIDVNAQEENDAALQLIEDASVDQRFLVFRCVFKSGAVRVWRGQVSPPGESVTRGQIGTGTIETTVKGKVIKGIA